MVHAALLLCSSLAWGAPDVIGVHARRSARIVRAFANDARHPTRNPNRNVLGGELECCCDNVRGTGIGTGFYRNGLCSTGADDAGRHTVCVQATAEFLAFSKAVGNDLSTPRPELMFPGLKPGDQWCLCASRWKQALEEGKEPPVLLRSTHEKTLQYVSLEQLRARALDLEEADRELAQLDQLRKMVEKTVKLDADGGKV
mmetsp:Transcript_5775/g.14795  ORF Transcript_5775/g.14795 Transcript_5775/m.14795 type:complete len:200 (-) Transcript_5775:133-732(-)|eukprot:CAMPEP_0119408200 /NCGR_PEP_ID=MMETSP1335-20130426/1828_1 /TAXON_ID=259385 /ORGANISM="Chrysoculter rhomboideus, Strain RCC1486" /LENGTH=199 /DNA_ID=CAMNT_0007432413 /DNA_START=32 /DNA_END=631 /DNA_ORIENTATION=-